MSQPGSRMRCLLRACSRLRSILHLFLSGRVSAKSHNAQNVSRLNDFRATCKSSDASSECAGSSTSKTWSFEVAWPTNLGSADQRVRVLGSPPCMASKVMTLASQRTLSLGAPPAKRWQSCRSSEEVCRQDNRVCGAAVMQHGRITFSATTAHASGGFAIALPSEVFVYTTAGGC